MSTTAASPLDARTSAPVTPGTGLATMEDIEAVRRLADSSNVAGFPVRSTVLRRVADLAEQALAPLPALTRSQRKLFDYVREFIEVFGYSPSFEEIAEHFGYSSLATVHEHVGNLEAKGYLTRDFNKPRSLALTPRAQLVPVALAAGGAP